MNELMANPFFVVAVVSVVLMLVFFFAWLNELSRTEGWERVAMILSASADDADQEAAFALINERGL